MPHDPVPSSEAGQTAQPLWTIMLYLSGDNDLGSMMINAINDVGNTKLVADGRVAITIQYDPVSPAFNTVRYDLTRVRTGLPHGSLPQEWALVKDEEFTAPENSADPNTLKEFIVWSLDRKRESPALQSREHYRMLVLSGHGSGAVGDFLPDDNRASAREGHSGPAAPERSSLTIRGLGRALRNAQSVLKERNQLKEGEELLHVLGMDSCLMGMAEVAYQVQDFAQYLVASEGFVPTQGWPYRHLLDCLQKRVDEKLDLKPLAISRCIVDDYLRYYAEQGSANVSVDISSCDLTNLRGMKQDSEGNLRITLADLSQTLCEHLNLNNGDALLVRDLLVLAHWRAQSFKYEQYTDLWDFCTELKTACERFGRFPQIVTDCDRVAKSVEALVSAGGETNALRQGSRGVAFQHAHGLSVYFPWADPGGNTLEHYQILESAGGKRQMGWGRFLRLYVDKTKRDLREVDESTGSPTGVIIRERPGWQLQRQISSVRDSPGYNRNSPGYNRNSPGYNRFLPWLGNTPPSSMKNPPTEDPRQTECANLTRVADTHALEHA